jgi:hypothetical protein
MAGARLDMMALQIRRQPAAQILGRERLADRADVVALALNRK